MTEATAIQTGWMILAAVLLVTGAGLTLIGATGLLRLHTFYERAHAPTLGTTLGTAFISIASIIHFSAGGGRLAIHELLIIVFVTATTPITLMILIGAARFRDNLEDRAPPDSNSP